MTNVISKTYDAAIVGAGPAGSSLAIRLAMNGLKILLVEQKRFPRDKLCGEFISPECLVHFDELGVTGEIDAAGANELFETVFYARHGRGVSVKSEWFGQNGSPAIGLSRAVMDKCLFDRAGDVGVEILAETIAIGSISIGGMITGLKLRDKTGSESEAFARVVVDATGRTRSLARRLSVESGPRQAAKFVAFKTHLTGAEIDPGVCEIYSYRGGYGGCSRVEHDLYDLCFIVSASDTKRLGSDAEVILRNIVFTNNRAAASLENAEIANPWLAVPIERYGRGDLVPAPGMITVGDAAAFIDPFTGSGILLALESSRIASEAIIAATINGNDFDRMATEYKRNYDLTFSRRLRICSILRYAASVPFLAGATISLLGLNSGLRRRVAQATRF